MWLGPRALTVDAASHGIVVCDESNFPTWYAIGKTIAFLRYVWRKGQLGG